ncbi:major facilitator superfamily domain-containing protein [Mucidula mucida]|nr:major facilitator superfamily domain-containing protein [Mucidula mucida]
MTDVLEPSSETCHSTNDKPEADIVADWDGEDDPRNPKTWSYAKKRRATLTVSLLTFVSPVSSSMIALNHTPSALGPLSELYGRTKGFQSGNLFFCVWNQACGFAQTESQRIAFKLFSGLSGCAPPAGGGSLADMWRPEERGKAVAIYSLATLLGPVVGPIAGGWIAEKTSWRWVLTYPPVLFERRAQAIRQSMDPEKCNRRVRTVFEKTESREYACVHAINHLFGKPIAQVIAVYSAIVYGVFYLTLTTIPTIVKVVHHEDVGVAARQYIALGLGLWIASQVNARYMDEIYLYLREKNSGVAAMVPGSVIFPIGMLISDWCADQGVHWVGTDIGLALVGCGAILILLSVQAYVVDTFALYAASAGFGFPLVAPAMYDALGYARV